MLVKAEFSGFWWCVLVGWFGFGFFMEVLKIIHIVFFLHIGAKFNKGVILLEEDQNTIDIQVA